MDDTAYIPDGNIIIKEPGDFTGDANAVRPEEGGLSLNEDSVELRIELPEITKLGSISLEDGSNIDFFTIQLLTSDDDEPEDVYTPDNRRVMSKSE